MRSTDHLSFLKTTLDQVKKSTDTVDSRTDDQPAKTSFYTEFTLKHKMRSSRIIKVNKITEPTSQETFAVVLLPT